MAAKTYPPLILALRIHETFHGLCLIEKGNDESLYIKFPRRNYYQVKSSNEFREIPTQITFSRNVRDIVNPYVSYHQSGNVHINLVAPKGKKHPFVKDKVTTKKVDLLPNKIYTPFCSMLFPINIVNYDSINHLSLKKFNYHEISNNPKLPEKDGQKTPSIIVIDREKLPTNVLLYAEVFIHKRLTPNEDLEFANTQKLNLIEQITVNNSTGNLSYTLLLKYIESKEENPKGELIVLVFNDQETIAFSME